MNYHETKNSLETERPQRKVYVHHPCQNQMDLQILYQMDPAHQVHCLKQLVHMHQDQPVRSRLSIKDQKEWHVTIE